MKKKNPLAEKIGKALSAELEKKPPSSTPPPSRLLAELRAEGAFEPLMSSKSPPPAIVSEVMARSVHRFISYYFGLDGVIAVMKNRRNVGRVFYWSRKDSIWKHIEFEDGEGSLMSAIYHDADFGFAPTLGAIAPGFPLAQNMQRDFNSIAAIVDKRHGREEEDLADIDRLRVDDYSTGKRSRFLWGDTLVNEIWMDENGWHHRDGVKNRKEFRLRKDLPRGARVAGDKEWKSNRKEMLEKLSAYCEGYALVNDVGPAAGDVPLAKDCPATLDADRVDLLSKSPLVLAGATCSTGNAWLDDLFITFAGSRVPVPLRNLMCMIGVSGSGKSALFRTLNGGLGNDILRIDLAKETFTGSDSLPRLQEHRAKLQHSCCGVSMDLATDAVLDSGFIKPLCTNEDVSFGGMYKSDITRPLEFTGFFSSNEMPRLNDNSDGTTERLWHLPFKKKYRGTKHQKSQPVLLAEFKHLFPTLRREIQEFIKALVKNLNCILPDQHPMMLESKQAAIEGSEYALKTYARKFFRPVNADAGPGDFDYNYRASGRALFNIPVGSRSKTGFCAGSNDRDARWRGFRALAALREHADRSGRDEKVAQQNTINRLLREGQSWTFDKNRRAFTGRVHTLEFVEHLHDKLDGKQPVLDFLRAFYGGAHRDDYIGSDIPRSLEDALLDDEMKAVFASDVPIPTLDDASDDGI